MQDKVRGGVPEDRFTGAIESQTSKVPSAGYLTAAFGAIAASAVLKLAGKDDWALFVGQWPAAFMLMGVYNKLVKQHGSDAFSKVA
jgi:hypothetical protein